jgi:N-acetylmuramoyl-L-alanine amidase
MDPGELFDWRRLAGRGIGFWPKPSTASRLSDDAALGRALGDYGYDLDDFPAAVAAFQRHFRPSRIDGRADEETRALAGALVDQTD